MISELPHPYEQFQKLAEFAFAEWAPTATVVFSALELTGRSGAAVVKADIRSTKEAELESGQYILKLSDYGRWQPVDDEAAAHLRAEQRSPAFAQAHIPKQRKSFTPPRDKGLGYAVLYEIAGMSVESFTATDGRESPGFFEICQQLSADMLASWADSDPAADLSPFQILEGWLGYRLIKSDAPELHQLAYSLGPVPNAYIVHGELLPNPLAFCMFSRAHAWTQRAALAGLLHNDVHGGNVLVPRRVPDRTRYWLIDFALSAEGILGFDHAYLELSQILSSLASPDPALLIGLLRILDRPEQPHFIPSGTKWLVDTVRAMREAVAQWQIARRRKDDLSRQFLLARIAAGINWANKPISEALKRIALYYSAWAAREYLSRYEPTAAEEFWASSGATDSRKTFEPQAVHTPSDEVLWEQLWGITAGFAPTAGRYVLVMEAVRDQPALALLGQLPLSAVIDLDPESTERGLYRYAEPLLQNRRSIHTSSNAFGTINFSRGTAWMMAAGWSRRKEEPTDYDTWRYLKLDHVRTLARSIDEQANPDPLFIISIAGQGLDSDLPMERLQNVLDAIGEATRGRARVLHLGPNPCSRRIKHTHIPMDLAYFLYRVGSVFGAQAAATSPQVPGKDKSWRSIGVDALRAMEENFVLLHTAILDGDRGDRDRNSDSFWRGNPPTWLDLHAGLDIRRSISDDVSQSLQVALDGVRNYTVVLSHTPGSGGTTASLRAAWDLHLRYPTAVLRRNSEALPDRIQDLYNATEAPVLLVAESATLPEASREDLYRQLLQRNVRVVFLYVRRVFQPGPKSLNLADPMKTQEARQFYEAYSALTEDRMRREELRRITRDDQFDRYRSPFFYGLIAFEREFSGTESYVQNHLAGTSETVSRALLYLALITVYSNSGLHELFLRRLLGLSDGLAVTLDEFLGVGPARLIIRRNGLLRMMHQIIAERVLECLRPDWRSELPQLSVDLIRALATHTQGHSGVVVDLLRQLFVERQVAEIDDVEDRRRFAPLIEEIDDVDNVLGHQVLIALTDSFPDEAHFWNHLGRHQIYRMRRDFEKAERYLMEATRLSPNDYIHHHTLGLVRRYQVQRLMGTAGMKSAAALLETLRPTFDSSVAAFERTRELNEDNVHAYITQIQLIVDVIRKLKERSGVRSIAHIGADIGEWVQDQVSIANGLFDTASELYSTLDRADTFLATCQVELARLYDDFNEVIRVWELACEGTGGNATSRRALAQAYLARSGRSWSALEDSERRRIVDLMERTFQYAGAREEDYRLWFESYRLLSHFEVDTALSMLNIWAERFPSWRAYYYIYSLQCLLWLQGRSDRTDECDRALERCQALAFGKKNLSHLWLGYVPAECPLVAAADLGEWDRQQRLWKDTSPLRRVNGIVDVIRGSQAGSVLIDGKVRGFFVPGTEFSKNADENEPINFFVGFSPSGLRAWGVRRGHLEHADRLFTEPRADIVLSTMAPPALEELKRARAAALRELRVLEFVEDLVRARSVLGLPVEVLELEKRVGAVFGVDDALKRAGGSVRQVVDASRVLEFGEREQVIRLRPSPQKKDSSPSGARSEGQVFRRAPAEKWGLLLDANGEARFFGHASTSADEWDKISTGAFVSFSPDRSAKGAVAKDVKYLRNGDVKELVRSQAIEVIRAATVNNKSLLLRDVIDALRRVFNGPIPEFAADALDRRMSALLRAIDGVTVRRRGDQIAVHVNESRAPGRTRVTDKEKGAPDERPTEGRSTTVDPNVAVSSVRKTTGAQAPVRGEPDLGRIGAAIREIVASRPSKRISIQELGVELKKRFKLPGRIAVHLGVRTFVDFLSTLDGIDLSGLPPKLTVGLSNREPSNVSPE